MKDFPVGTKVRIKNYGGKDASTNDKKLNGAIGFVVCGRTPNTTYLRVKLVEPIGLLESALCLSRELDVIES